MELGSTRAIQFFVLRGTREYSVISFGTREYPVTSVNDTCGNRKYPVIPALGAHGTPETQSLELLILVVLSTPK